MFTDDDFLLSKPTRRESVAVIRIALMAAVGCLMLLAALVIQARAQPDFRPHGPTAAEQTVTPPEAPHAARGAAVAPSVP